MKRVGSLKSKILDYDNILLAAHKAFKGKRGKYEVQEFLLDFDANISELILSLENETIDLGNYHYFKIYDPKERKICAATLKERIVHHALMNVCHDFFDKRLIYDSYATRPGKGVYAALDRVKDRMRYYKYYAKLDVKKYYDNIDHSVMYDKLSHIFKDSWVLSVFKQIIDSYNVTEGKGLPIGNLTSQYFANLYLSDLDHYMKEVLHIPIYIRYMDDVLILMNDSMDIKRAVDQFVKYAQDKLSLTIKPPVLGKTEQGIPFLGYKVMAGYLLLGGRSKRRYRHKLLAYSNCFHKGEFTEKDYANHLTPLTAFALHASSKSFRRSCIELGINERSE